MSRNAEQLARAGASAAGSARFATLALRTRVHSIPCSCPAPSLAPVTRDLPTVAGNMEESAPQLLGQCKRWVNVLGAAALPERLCLAALPGLPPLPELPATAQPPPPRCAACSRHRRLPRCRGPPTPRTAACPPPPRACAVGRLPANPTAWLWHRARPSLCGGLQQGGARAAGGGPRCQQKWAGRERHWEGER